MNKYLTAEPKGKDAEGESGFPLLHTRPRQRRVSGSASGWRGNDSKVCNFIFTMVEALQSNGLRKANMF
ncbi:hypothetical protein ACFL4Z_04055 [candidate division KSB1 bacterium]